MDHVQHASPSESAHQHDKHAMASAHKAHDRHAGHSVAMFRDKFWLTLAFTIPVVVWSAEVQHWLGYTAPVFPGSKWIPAIFGTLGSRTEGSFFSAERRGNWPIASLA